MHFTTRDALKALISLKINPAKTDLVQLADGMNVELEHGTKSGDLNVTNNATVPTAQIALAHLREDPHYYILLRQMEKKFKKEAATKSLPRVRHISDDPTLDAPIQAIGSVNTARANAPDRIMFEQPEWSSQPEHEGTRSVGGFGF